MKRISKLRLQILLRTFNLPIMCLCFVIPGLFHLKIGSVVVFAVLLVGSFIAALYDDRKFLIDLVITDEKYLLTYLTVLGKKKQLLIPCDKIVRTLFKEQKLLVRDFATIEIFGEQKQVEFLIINTDIVKTCEALFGQSDNTKSQTKVVAR